MTSDADRRDAFVKPSGNHRYLRAADHVQFVAIDRISRLAARRLSGHGAAGPADYGWQERAADFFCEAADFRVAVGLGGVAGEVSVFEDDTINLLMVRTCQSPLSAALIGWVEAHVAEPAEKNALCDPVPSPAAPVDWLGCGRRRYAIRRGGVGGPISTPGCATAV